MGQTERHGINSSHLRPVKKIHDGNKMDALVLNNKGNMGHNLNGNWMVGKSSHSGKGVVHLYGNSIYRIIIKRYTAMAETKVVVWFANLLGIPAYLISAWMNFGDLKGYMLLAIAFVYGCAKVYFYIRKQNDEDKMRKLKIKEREHEVQEILNDDES